MKKSQYTEETLARLVSLNSALPTAEYYSKNFRITLQLRNKLNDWVIALAHNYKTNIESLQLSITIIDRFLASCWVTKSSILLIGVCAYNLGLKTHNSQSLTLEEAIARTNSRYTKEDLITIELSILQELGWSLNFPTSAEFIRQLLYITGVNYDFTRVIERSDSFALVCYGRSELARYTPLEIAIVSVVSALEQFSQLGFRNQWVKLLNMKLRLNLDGLDDCKKRLVSIVKSMEGGQSDMVKCLEAERISQLII